MKNRRVLNEITNLLKVIYLPSLVVLLPLSILIFAAFYLTLIAQTTSSSSSSNNFILYSVLSMIASNFTVISIYNLRLSKKRLSMVKELKFEAKLQVKEIIISLLLVLLIFIFSLFATHVIKPIFFETATTTEKLLNYSGAFPFVVIVLYPLIIAPITEEIIFRGISGNILGVFNKEATKITKITFVILSSTVFALMHLQLNADPFTNFLTFFSPFISGIVFSTNYLHSKNISYPIITHIAYNSLVFLFSSI